jgi:putative transposase
VVFLTQKEDPTRACLAQILAALRGAEGGTIGVDVCRRVGISEQTVYAWKRKYAGLSLSELRGLRQLREKNAKLKRLVADLSLDRQMLQEIVRKSCTASGPACAGTLGANDLPVSERRVSRLLLMARASLQYRSRRDPCCVCGCESWRRAEYASGIGDSRCC